MEIRSWNIRKQVQFKDMTLMRVWALNTADTGRVPTLAVAWSSWRLNAEGKWEFQFHSTFVSAAATRLNGNTSVDEAKRNKVQQPILTKDCCRSLSPTTSMCSFTIWTILSSSPWAIISYHSTLYILNGQYSVVCYTIWYLNLPFSY
jgi:hypothetical protein